MSADGEPSSARRDFGAPRAVRRAYTRHEMAFRWFRRRPAPAPDPIAAYDDLVSDLSAEAAELRRAAATLLTVRARLGRELAGDRAGGADASRSRRPGAGSVGWPDRRGARRRRGPGGRTGDRDCARSWPGTETDVAQLEEAARRVADQVDRLRSERDLAAARLTAGTALAAEAQRSRADRIRRLVAVDAARDEIERAHALAEVWREDAGLERPSCSLPGAPGLRAQVRRALWCSSRRMPPSLKSRTAPEVWLTTSARHWVAAVMFAAAA